MPRPKKQQTLKQALISNTDQVALELLTFAKQGNMGEVMRAAKIVRRAVILDRLDEISKIINMRPELPGLEILKQEVKNLDGELSTLNV